MIGRFGRIALAMTRNGTRLALFALVVSLPQSALAKPYSTGSDPTLNGDPTADDQPSTAPKGSLSAKFVPSGPQGQADSIRARAREVNSRVAFEIFFRLLLNIR